MLPKPASSRSITRGMFPTDIAANGLPAQFIPPRAMIHQDELSAGHLCCLGSGRLRNSSRWRLLTATVPREEPHSNLEVRMRSLFYILVIAVLVTAAFKLLDMF